MAILGRVISLDRGYPLVRLLEHGVPKPEAEAEALIGSTQGQIGSKPGTAAVGTAAPGTAPNTAVPSTAASSTAAPNTSAPNGASTDNELRAQHSIELVKNSGHRAVIGDIVELEFPPGQDIPLICTIMPRGHSLVRRSLVESRHVGSGKYDEQILATNIDIVIVVSSLSNRKIDLNYIERQLVLAHQSGAEVVILLTKADQAKHLEEDIAELQSIAFGCPVIVESAVTGEGLRQVAELLAGGRIGVLLGRSGVGKSTLINELLGAPLLQTGKVRERDRAGRHTTVARRMVFIEPSTWSQAEAPSTWPQTGAPDATDGAKSSPTTAGVLIDAPGLRSVGLYDARAGLAATFPEIVSLAEECRYRDCGHSNEPGCAVVAAVAAGILSERRLNSYQTIAAEVQD